jgi:hypothetical protein
MTARRHRPSDSGYVGWLRLISSGGSRGWKRVCQHTDESKCWKMTRATREAPPWKSVVCCSWVVLTAGESPVKLRLAGGGRPATT